MNAEQAVWLIVGAVLCLVFLTIAVNAFRK